MAKSCFSSWGGSGVDFGMEFQVLDCLGVDFGALGGHLGLQNGYFLTFWGDFDPCWVLDHQKVGLVQKSSGPWEHFVRILSSIFVFPRAKNCKNGHQIVEILVRVTLASNFSSG